MLPDFIARHSSLQSALPILFDAAIKGAFLVLIAAAAVYLLRNRSAASRHAVWTAAVIGHLAIPALVFLLPAWTLPVLPTPQWVQGAGSSVVSNGSPTVQSTASGPTAQRTVASQTGITNATTTAVSNAKAPAIARGLPGSLAGRGGQASIAARMGGAFKAMSTIQILAAMWIVGALLVLLRLAIGTWRVGQLAREGTRVEDGVWLSLTQRLANRLGVTRPLILLRGEKLAVPVTWGIVYPAVLLPQDADEWTEERRRFVLVHEMAHVKRFDALTQLLAQLSLAIFWFDPLVWLAAHRMRVEREHACDDYVLRDGTTPSLYAGELLEMVRSIGTPSHDTAAPAFAALAMARRSEFEGRMLAILDPRLDRQTLNRRSTIMTSIVVALLTFPLAAWRPFQQPAAPRDEFPESFQVTLSEPKNAVPANEARPAASTVATSGAGKTTPAAPVTKSSQASATKWTCEAYPVGTELHGTSTHVDSHDDGSDQSVRYLVSERGRCTEAQIIGRVVFSPDETRVTQLAPGAFARFRERTSSMDRLVSITPVGDGSLNYAAVIDGKVVPFDAQMQAWLSGILPEILREAPINAPDRVARIRAQSGVSGVLKMISQIRSTGAKRTHYEALLEGGQLSAADAEKIATQAPRDLAGSSGDLSAVLQKLPRNVMQSAAARNALADALPRIQSSGDRVNTLELLAPNADPEMLILLAKTAETLPSSGDKANFLLSTAAEYLSGPSEALHNAYFRAVATIPSSGDMANVLISAMPFGHANPGITAQVIEVSKGLASSGDAANVLISLVSQRLLQPSTRATIAVIDRTLTMASSGDRANVLVSIANQDLLGTREVKDRFLQAAAALPSEGDRVNVLAAAARR
jgi:beta-lactamase regulating signal transducer with metallopeptidase domain